LVHRHDFASLKRIYALIIDVRIHLTINIDFISRALDTSEVMHCITADVTSEPVKIKLETNGKTKTKTKNQPHP
jgi:hypothetical protein